MVPQIDAFEQSGRNMLIDTRRFAFYTIRIYYDANGKNNPPAGGGLIGVGVHTHAITASRGGVFVKGTSVSGMDCISVP